MMVRGGGIRTIAAATQNLKPNLVGFWEFETTSWLDSTANALNLNNSFGGGSVTTAAGLIGNAVALTGIKVIYHNDAALFDFTSSWTIAFWIKLTGTPTNGSHTVAKYRSNGEWRVFWENTSGSNWRLNFLIYASDTTHDQVNSATQDLTTVWQAGWHFVVAQCDASGNQIYISIDNGIPLSTGKTKTITHNTDQFQVGDFDFAISEMIDQLGFWTRVLTTAELTFLYNSGIGRAYSEL